MSWQTDIENRVFEIITGDGRSYKPKWKNASKVVEYNVSQFNFIGITGSLVDRKKPKAREFELEFYFDGDNAIDEGNNFEISARNTKRWTMKHPFYGDIICQPISLSQDNNKLNVSKFSVKVLETLIEGWAKADIVVSDKISELEANLQLISASVLTVDTIDKTALKATVNQIDTIHSRWINSSSDLANFKRAVSDAIVAIDEPLFDAVLAVRNVQAALNFPATVIRSVKDRLNVLYEALVNIIDTFNGTFENKLQSEILGGGLVSSMFKASTINITDDYLLKTKVIETQDLLLEAYNRYLLFLDSLQTERVDSIESYAANFDNINTLDEISNVTLSNLYSIAFLAKQERVFINDAESNPILLCHRFYGIDSDDINLNKFINENNIGLNELLSIRQGRRIVYYA